MVAAAFACEAPARWLAVNAGLNPNVAVNRARQAPCGHGIDITTGSLTDLRKAGILDSAETLKRALQIGLTTAILASDCGVLLHRPISLTHAEIRP
jgi:chaperonin GroEL